MDKDNKELSEEELEMIYEKRKMEKFDINYNRNKAQFTEGSNPSFPQSNDHRKLINERPNRW